MNGGEFTWADIVKRLVENGAWGAVMIGGIGGIANFVLDDNAKRKDVVRYFLAGAMISAGCGAAILAIAAKLLGLPAEIIPVGMAAGPASFMAGMLGPPVVRFLLRKL